MIAKPDEINKAIASGFALSQAFTDHAVEGIGRIMGGKFVVGRAGLSLVSGESLSTEEAAKAVSSLAEISERNQVVGATTMLALGDLLVIVRASFGDAAAEEIINQSVSIHGRSKHTIREAERTVLWCNEIFGENRPDNLYPTHFLEMKNGSRSKTGEVLIPKEMVLEVAAEIVKGHVVGEVDTPDGRTIKQRKPLSCAKTRELLTKARESAIAKSPTPPLKPVVIQSTESPPMQEASPPSTYPTYVYIDRHDKSAAFSYDDIPDDDYMGEDYIVISMRTKEVLGEDGEPISEVQDI